MPYKQKNKRYNSRTEDYDDAYQQLSKQRKLVLAWQEDNINDSYQSIVLKYFDQFSGRELQNQISRELISCYHKSSYYHKIQFLINERQRALDLLYERCCKINDSLENKEYLEYDLQQVCDLIDHIRKTSMYISESVWEMFEYFRFKGTSKSSLSEGKYYINIFASFDKDWAFAKESVLKYYIPFTNTFDPLLIQAAKPLKKLYSENKIVYNEHVDELFRINASYLYRLLKAHQRILDIFILSKDIQAKKEEKQIEAEQYSYQKAISHYSSSSKADRRTQPTYEYNGPTLSNKEKRASSNRNGSKEKKLIRFTTQQPKQKSEKDNRKITRISQITVSNKSKQDYWESHYPKKLQQTNQSQRGSLSKQQTELGYIKKQKPLSRTQPLDNNMYLSRNIHPNGLDLNEEKQKQKSAKVEKKPLIRRKRSKTFHLPKLQRDQHLHHDQSSDCQCRQRYRSRLKQSSAEIPPEQAEQRRHTIIKRINQKYKQLAKKQIRYELSILGDATYHRMKGKSRVKQRQRQEKKYSSKKYKNFIV